MPVLQTSNGALRPQSPDRQAGLFYFGLSGLGSLQLVSLIPDPLPKLKHARHDPRSFTRPFMRSGMEWAICLRSGKGCNVMGMLLIPDCGLVFSH